MSTSCVGPSSATGTCKWASFGRFDILFDRRRPPPRSFDDFRTKKDRNRAPVLLEDLLLPVQVHAVPLPELGDLFHAGLLVLVLPASAIRLRTKEISRGMAERE